MKTIFITGFPGFIAGRLIETLLNRSEHFLLLAQPAFAARAREHIARIAEQSGASAATFEVLEGDITEPNLGLGAYEFTRATSEVTDVFHLAAAYDLGVPRNLAMRVNLEGTRNVNRFAASVRDLHRYNYVSTCYVAGLREGVIYENELKHEAGFHNYYEESKYLAELEVEALKKQLAVTIYRPSVVCGDSRNGETAKYDGVYFLINYVRQQPAILSLMNIGSHEASLNIVPVDYVVKAISVLGDDERAVGATAQLADPLPPSTHELFDMVGRSLAGRVSRLTVPTRLVQTTLSIPVSELISGLPMAAAPYFFAHQTYDTTQASSLLERHGVTCPAFQSYVDVLTNFVDRHPVAVKKEPLLQRFARSFKPAEPDSNL